MQKGTVLEEEKDESNIIAAVVTTLILRSINSQVISSSVEFFDLLECLLPGIV
jgi:hypothetical protein